MIYNSLKCFMLAGMLVVVCHTAADAQSAPEAYGQQHATQGQVPSAPMQGPHGGTLRQLDSLQFETIVSQGGIQLFVFDHTGQPLSVESGRGAASLRIEGNAKRYRYDLLPDGKGGLSAPVNLSQIAGRQIEMNFQLVGLPGIGSQTLHLQEVSTVPASQQQLAAAAIARQKICPVSGKPLGSMGEPVAVNVNGQTVYACCSGCVKTIQATPAKYASGRLEIVVSTATEADAALVAKQGTCPVMDESLGSMGTPIKVMVGDKPIFLCCKGCVKKIQSEPAKYLAMVHGEEGVSQGEGESGSVPIGIVQEREGVFKVGAEDAPFIAAQKRCPVMDEPLDAMGGPYKVNADGKAIYICCPGCAKKIAAEPQKYLAVLKSQGVAAPALR